MLWSANVLRGYSLRATDDTLGHVHDFYFDDREWGVRYLVVDTGGWLFGRRVLVSPSACGHPDVQQQAVPVALTREQVKHSPDIDTERPVDRQMEAELHAYYGWAPYWGGFGIPYAPGLAAAAITPGLAPGESATDREQRGDPHLRSVRDVEGYHIHATDGRIGHVDDFLIEDEGWRIRYLVVDRRAWMPGGQVLISPDWVTKIEWVDREVYVDHPKSQIEHSPPLESLAGIDRAYEERVFRHYGRQPYWERPFPSGG